MQEKNEKYLHFFSPLPADNPRLFLSIVASSYLLFPTACQ
jgi:hypothetical protein